MQKSFAMAAMVAVTLAMSAAHGQTPPAEPPPGGPPPDDSRGERGALFVNPMGQAFRASPESRRAPILLWLAHADADHDGRISRDEFVNEAMAFFANDLDANHDHTVIPIESTEFRRLHAPETLNLDTAPVTVTPTRQHRESNNGIVGARPEVRSMSSVNGLSQLGPPQSRNGPPPQRRGRLRQDEVMLGAEVEPVMSCDRDFSRRIDAAEFQACAERRFVALDVNRDGYFELHESERARAMLEAYGD
ncbi:MAG: hypothetical protein KF779_07765 [Hyphomonadaceae bacterium]|nr:hypothetical protein [Hyphomonadaceae bacterium]MCA8885960.1 hypothetical protein [Hyphomonadaceae bacterium]